MIKAEIKTADYQQEFSLIRAIRKQVFQQEQGVAPELEFDGQDDKAIHLLAYINELPVGTTRIRELTPGKFKIERLAVLPQFRGQGIAKQLMQKALAIITEQNYQEVLVHAQAYIKGLYEKLGFNQIGNSFTEAGIVHVKMVRKTQN